MRNSLQCPKCGGRQFFEVGACTIPAHDSINGTEPLSVAAAYLPTGDKTFFGRDNKRFVARLTAWVCAPCGFTEFYTAKLDVLRYMVQNQAASVRFVDGSVAEPARR